MRFLLVCISIILSACVETPAEESGSVDDPADVISGAVGAALQGNARRAVELLASVEDEALSEDDMAFRSCMLNRFGRAKTIQKTEENLYDFTARLTNVFRAYWQSALTQPESRADAAERLDQQLRDLLGLSDSAQIYEIEESVHARLEEEGAGGLLGQTGLLRELMIWQQEERRAVEVELPHGSYMTNVAFLDDFIISGWTQFATCETRGAGGWVADHTLFAVVPLYDDLDGEEFRVTFLGHETQHFLDLENYPDMKSWELEYRAKLIELSMADETRLRVLQKFIEDQSDDSDSPHSYANRQVLRGLMEQLSLSDIEALKSVSGETMRQAAYSLYKVDTAKRDLADR